MILAIDTSGPVCGTAILDASRVYSETIAQNRNTHSASLMPMVERSLEIAGASLRDLEAIAVVVGPGSFTGVRIGVATAKGLAHGANLPCIPVDALEALAESTGRSAQSDLLCPIQDARAGQVYGAIFRGQDRLLQDIPLKLEDYLDAVREKGPGPYYFVGDAVPVHRDRIREILGGDAVLPPPPFAFLRPSAAGFLALRKGAPVDYLSLKEFYLRPPSAEKNKKLLEAMRHE